MKKFRPFVFLCSALIFFVIYGCGKSDKTADTESMAKSQTLDIKLPEAGKKDNKEKKTTTTLLLNSEPGENGRKTIHKVYLYEGEPDTSFSSPDFLREYYLSRVDDSVIPHISEYLKGKNNVFAVKPIEDAVYESLILALDELQLHSIRNFSIELPDHADSILFKEFIRQHPTR